MIDTPVIHFSCVKNRVEICGVKLKEASWSGLSVSIEHIYHKKSGLDIRKRRELPRRRWKIGNVELMSARQVGCGRLARLDFYGGESCRKTQKVK